MSVPTTYFAASGKAKQHCQREERPAPDRGEADDEPADERRSPTATIRSRFVSRLDRRSWARFLCSSALATNETAPISRVKPSTLALHRVDAVPVAVGQVGGHPDAEEGRGGAPDQHPERPSRALTVPSRRCRTAPNDLKIAPWRMSVPIAAAGLKSKKKMRIGVISEPPPIPVMPTSRPVMNPADGKSSGRSRRISERRGRRRSRAACTSWATLPSTRRSKKPLLAHADDDQVDIPAPRRA